MHKLLLKKILQKYNKLAKKKAPVPFNISDGADAEAIDYNKDSKYHHLRRKRKSTLDISELHVFPSSKQNKATSSNSRNKNGKIAAKNFLEKYKKMSRKKTPFSFNISDIADVGTVDYNNDTNISDVLLNKSVQITAKKAVKNIKF